MDRMGYPRLPGNAETVAVFQRGNGGNGLVVDVACDGGFDGDFADEGVHFVGLAHDLEFDAAIGQVFHAPADVEATGEVFDRVAEPDALDAAFKDDAFGDQRLLPAGRAFGLVGVPSLNGLVSRAEDLTPKTCSMVLPGRRL